MAPSLLLLRQISTIFSICLFLQFSGTEAVELNFDTTEGILIIVGIICGGIAAVIVLIFCCCYCGKDKDKDEQFEQQQQRAPNVATAAAPVYIESSISDKSHTPAPTQFVHPQQHQHSPSPSPAGYNDDYQRHPSHAQSPTSPHGYNYEPQHQIHSPTSPTHPNYAHLSRQSQQQSRPSSIQGPPVPAKPAGASSQHPQQHQQNRGILKVPSQTQPSPQQANSPFQRHSAYNSSNHDFERNAVGIRNSGRIQAQQLYNYGHYPEVQDDTLMITIDSLLIEELKTKLPPKKPHLKSGPGGTHPNHHSDYSSGTGYDPSNQTQLSVSTIYDENEPDEDYDEYENGGGGGGTGGGDGGWGQQHDGGASNQRIPRIASQQQQQHSPRY